MDFEVGQKVYLPFEVKDIQGNTVKLNNDSIGDIIHNKKNVLKESIPIRHKVTQVAIDFYNRYKNNQLSFEEWFSDFYSIGFREEFPDGEKLVQWLYDNDYQTNRERELALATLIVKGEDAVEVIKDVKYKVRLTNSWNDFSTLKQNKSTKLWLFGSDDSEYSDFYKYTFTKEELEQMGLSEVFTTENIFIVEEVV